MRSCTMIILVAIVAQASANELTESHASHATDAQDVSSFAGALNVSPLQHADLDGTTLLVPSSSSLLSVPSSLLPFSSRHASSGRRESLAHAGVDGPAGGQEIVSSMGSRGMSQGELFTSKRKLVGSGLAAALTAAVAPLAVSMPANAGIFDGVKEFKRKSILQTWLSVVRYSRDNLRESEQLANTGKYDESLEKLNEAAQDCVVPDAGSLQASNPVDTCAFRILVKNVKKQSREFMDASVETQNSAAIGAFSTMEALIKDLEALRTDLRQAKGGSEDAQKVLKERFATCQRDEDAFELALQAVLGVEKPSLDLSISLLEQPFTEVIIDTPIAVLISFFVGSGIVLAMLRFRHDASALVREPLFAA